LQLDLSEGDIVETNSQVVTRFVQGRRVVDARRGIVHSYELTPLRAGALRIPAPTADADGEEVRGDPIDLVVVAPADQEFVKLHASVERSGTYPLQPFTVELRVFVRRLPPPYQDDDPLAYLDAAPRLRVPWVEPPDGVEAARELSSWLTPHLAQPRGMQPRVGFTVNDLTFRGNDLFSLMDRPRSAIFDLQGRVADPAAVAGAPGLAGRGDEYFVYRLRRRFVPLRSGAIEFAPSSVRGSFIVDVKDRRGVTEDVFVRGGGLTVEVDDAPEEGRPSTFDGAFGTRFTLRADVEPRRARVGDPLVLTLEIEGRGNVDEIDAPDLAARPAFADAFRIEPPTVERKGAALSARYTLRAATADVDRVPPIGFAWFDLDAEAYRETASAAVPIEIEEIAALGANDIVRYGADADVRDPTRAEGLFGNLTDPRQVEDERVPRTLAAAAPVLSLVAYALLAWFVTRRRRLAGDPVRKRRRTAGDRALRRAAEARERAAAGDAVAAATGVAAALRGLAADAAGVPEAGLLPRDAADHLRSAGVDDATVDRVRRFLDEVDGLRYGGGVSAAGEDADALVKDVLAALRKKGAVS
ncbi:MAG: hypothetical protein ACF8XB_02320, partial [Planctomycetota bacterium JB042]